MNWKHPRNMSNAERKQQETRAGTDSNFIAAMLLAA
jgi:hypothetical protein